MTHLLVTGIVRSGSTYTGNVLKKVDGLFYMQEPFNYRRGLVGVKHWFPYADGPGDPYADLVDRFLACEFDYKQASTPSLLRNALKQVVGNHVSLRAHYYRLVARHRAGMLIKDPLAAFLSRYMHAQHGIPVVVLVRHPMAFYNSYKRLGWHFEFAHFLTQEALIENHLQEEVAWMERAEHLSFPQQVGLLWRCVYKVLTDFSREFEDDPAWVVMRHEDLCRRPLEEFERMLAPLPFALNEAARNYIRQTTRDDNPVQVPDGKAHVLNRNAQELAEYWMQRVSADEIDAVRTLTEDVAALYYDPALWGKALRVCAG